MSQALGCTRLIILEKKQQHKITFFSVLAVIGSILCFHVRGIAAVNDK